MIRRYRRGDVALARIPEDRCRRGRCLLAGRR